MEPNELRTGLLVQHTTARGTDLYQVSTVYPQGAAMQWVYSRTGEDGYLPSRTSVVIFSSRDIERHLRPASTRMANRFQEALAGSRAGVGA
ncbi:MAG: hypothetical protein O3B27_10230 [Actinomycetota bacterium]|nr:hypothetical protein [Actinomycetota bacterium]MDA2948929.1 hypothetical protein [Actinomycetota bacterium]MDA2991920.1 hypothetical protein [Actinomycetota bacterium]